MREHQLLDRAQFSRAAIHLIQTHGSRAATTATKRAVYLHQCGEVGAADTWRRIADRVRAIEAADKPCAGTPEGDSSESSERQGAVIDEVEAERSVVSAE
jgi:hypothetical protein